MKRMGWLGACAVVGLTISGCNPFGSPLVSACEAALKASLTGTPSYERIELTELTETITLDDYLAVKNDRAAVRLARAGVKPERHIVNFRFRTQLGDQSSQCVYETIDGDASKATQYTVRIDGRTQTGRLVDAALDR